jgi:hypothetical protein
MKSLDAPKNSSSGLPVIVFIVSPYHFALHYGVFHYLHPLFGGTEKGKLGCGGNGKRGNMALW